MASNNSNWMGIPFEFFQFYFNPKMRWHFFPIQKIMDKDVTNQQNGMFATSKHLPLFKVVGI
jgi:hypothetical protein